MRQGSREKSQEEMQEPGGMELGAIVLWSCFRTCTSFQWVAEWDCMEWRRVVMVRNVRREKDEGIDIF